MKRTIQWNPYEHILTLLIMTLTHYFQNLYTIPESDCKYFPSHDEIFKVTVKNV